jgi:hypothetical protein
MDSRFRGNDVTFDGRSEASPQFVVLSEFKKTTAEILRPPMSAADLG